MNELNGFRLRLLIIAVIMGIGFSILGIKLWYEQVHSSERYRRNISRQSLRRVRLPGLRGKIFSSDYILLADNAPSYNLVFYLQEMRRNSMRSTVKNIRSIASELSRELNRADSLTEEKIRRHINVMPGMPLVIYRDLSEIELARAYQLMPNMPGVGIEVEPVRNYPMGPLASLVIGFTRFEAANDALDRRDYFYYRSDYEGRSGVERAFDDTAGNYSVPGLHGQPGYELMQVDHLGYTSERHLEYAPPINGSNIVLTLDARAQALGEKLLQGQRGSLVLLNAETGEILALASSPHLDLSRITPIWTHAYYSELASDPGKPMFDRATRGTYMPGSIIKPIVALAALSNNWDPEQKIDCDGGTVINGARIACASRYGHGELNLVEAIERSCNDYFIEMGMSLGVEKLTEMYRYAGIGQFPGLEIGAARGMNPSERVKSQHYKWRDYDTALISIGQGQILLSPLQAARYTAAVANGGKLMETILLKEVYDEEGQLLFRNQPRLTYQWQLPEGALECVHQGMYMVVNSPRGSGRSARSEELTIYGKTGTAEVDTAEGRIKNTWFTCFTRHESGVYALTILVEEGSSGGRDCAPLARDFFENYLGGML